MPQTILIVDAEPVVRSVVSAILRSGGYSVLEAADFRQGMDLLQTRDVDLLLTNVNLPGMTGAEAMGQFKSARPELRVLMISGLPDNEVIYNWIEDRKFQVFPKPFAADGLLKKVRAVLADEPQQALEQADGAGRTG